MRRRVANYILLIIIITSSFFSICTFDLYPSGPYDKSLDNFRLLAPGVIFSLFISILQRRRFSIGKSILFFCILLVFYSIALVAGMSSYGVGVPFAGGFGALLIVLLPTKGHWYRWRWVWRYFNHMAGCVWAAVDKTN